MEGAAPFEAVDTCGIDPRFMMMAAVDMPALNREKGRWYSAVPPLTRENTGLCPADYFGRALLEKMPRNSRVGVVNVAVGGCRIELLTRIRVRLCWLRGLTGCAAHRPCMTAILTNDLSGWLVRQSAAE